MKTRVEYEDGTSAVYKVKPRHLVAFEETHGGFDESVRGVFTLAHLASGSALSFDAWLDTVEDITPEGAVEKDAAEVPTE